MRSGPDSRARAGDAPDAPAGEARARSAEDRSESEIRAARPDLDAKRRERESTQEIVLRAASAPPIVEADVEPFARFGRFGLLGRLATGGMAELLLARESVEGSAGSRYVVIKAIRGEYAEDGEFAKMFLDEGRLAMRLTHPNICTVLECGRHDGRFFMAMEYVHGRTLREVLVRAARRERPLPIPVLLRIFALVAEALDFAHRAKDSQGRKLAVVHRDVSPHNVMLRYDGVVKLLDFGVAKAEHSQHSTQSGALKGKFSYMSPEQAMGGAVDARADIFSLGVCIFEAVTGRRLFHRKAQYDTLKAILESEPPPLSSFRDDVPEGLQKIVSRALAKAPEQRYQRASELQHDLEALLTEMREVASTARIAELMEDLYGDEAQRAPALEVDDELRARFAEKAEEPAAAEGPVPASRWPLWAALAALAAALAVGGAWAALAGPDAPEAAAARGETAPEPPPPRPVAEARQPEQAHGLAAESESGSAPPASDGTLRGSEEAAQDAPPTPTEEGASPASTPATQRPPRERTGRRPRGTVIVTDPGF